MPTQLQIRRGSTTDHNSFTGAAGELTVDTTKDTLRVHDGSTAGGFELARADGSNLNNITSNITVNGTVTADGLTSSGVIKTEGTSLGFVLNETDTTDLNSYMYLQSGTLRFTTTNDAFNSFDTRMSISNSTGDISFYDAAGTSQSLFWDSSAERLGLGTSSPKTQLDIATGTGSAAGPELTLTNGYAGLTTGDRVGAINFYTSDGSNRGPNNSAVIEAQAATSLGHDANLVFKTGVPASEGQDAVETMRIDYQGNCLHRHLHRCFF